MAAIDIPKTCSRYESKFSRVHTLIPLVVCFANFDDTSDINYTLTAGIILRFIMRHVTCDIFILITTKHCNRYTNQTQQALNHMVAFTITTTAMQKRKHAPCR